jgi:2'-phosphotransferase
MTASTVSLGGFISVDDILALPKFKKKRLSRADVERIVANNNKQRFSLKMADGDRLLIRANQGHTMEVEELELAEIVDPKEAPVVVHGTYLACLEAIKRDGLCRMKRTHIHFAPGIPGDKEVISGMRSSCQVLIFVDIAKALKAGYKFYRSANNVILCPGNEEGYLPSEYFEKIQEIRCCVCVFVWCVCVQVDNMLF